MPAAVPPIIKAPWPVRPVAFACVGAALLVAGLTIIGWTTGHAALASVRAHYIPMAPSTAWCFAALSLGLLVSLLWPVRRWLARVPAFVVLGVAAAKLLELAFGWKTGLDAWLVRAPEQFGDVLTGRMSPITAANFIFLAAALIALTLPRFRPATGSLGALAAGVGAAVIVGYWYGTPLLYAGHIIPVALTTAFAFLLLGAGVIAAAGRDVWPLRPFSGTSTRALLLRYFVPLIVAATLCNGWLRAMLLADPRVNPAALSAVSALGFLVLILWLVSKVTAIVGGSIDRAEAARDVAQAEIAALNALLEQKVLDRTQQLREKNEQMGEELQMARELQLALLPHQYPIVPPTALPQESALRFQTLYIPTTDVSGDFFAIIPLSDDAVGVFICDVMGHGVRSALVTSMIHALVEENAAKIEDPGAVLTSLNRALVRIFKQTGTTMFATGLYLVADVRQGQWRYASAGHPAPLLIGAGDSHAGRLQTPGDSGPAMGIFPTAIFNSATRAMTPGEFLMLFTDGLCEVESETGELFTEELLLETARRHANLPPAQMLDRIVEDVRQFAHNKKFDDDVCVVGVQALRVHQPEAEKAQAAPRTAAV